MSKDCERCRKSDFRFCAVCKHWKKTVFQQITESLEVLAEKFLYAIAYTVPSHVGTEIYWKSTIIPDGKWKSEEEALAATVAKLKEVER